MPIKYQNSSFNIPINIVLTEHFPNTAPKVFLAFELDSNTSKDNPLIKNGNEVMNNYIFKWQGNSQQYNLGGLCFNLSKSFNLYPPLGKAGGSTLDPDVIYITNDSSRPLPSGVVKKDYSVHNTPQTTPVNTHQVSREISEADQHKVIERSERQERVRKIKQKLEDKLSLLNSSIGGINADSSGDDLIKQSKSYLDDNSEKLRKYALVLDNEKTEMEDEIKRMKGFISKNKDKDFNQVSYLTIDHLIPIHF